MFSARKHRLVRTELGLEWPSCLDCKHARHWPMGMARCKKDKTLTEIARMTPMQETHCGKTGRFFKLRRLPWPRLDSMYLVIVGFQAALAALNVAAWLFLDMQANFFIAAGIVVLSAPMMPLWAKLWRRIRGKA